MFNKIYYDDSNVDEQTFIKSIGQNKNDITDTYVKVVVVNKTNSYLFDMLIDEIYSAQPADLSIVEDFTDVLDTNNDVSVDQAQDTLTILSNYIDGQSLSIESAKLKTLMRELYIEALSTENVE